MEDSPQPLSPLGDTNKTTDEEENEFNVRNVINNAIANLKKYAAPNNYPTLACIKDLISFNIDIPWKSPLLQNWLEKINFFLLDKDNDGIIIEDPTIVFERYHYFKRIIEHNNKRGPKNRDSNVYYIEGRWLDDTLQFRRCWEQEYDIKSLVDMKKIVYITCCTETSFVGGVLLNLPKGQETFEHWMVNDVISNLQTPSLFVMDHAPYYNSVINQVPSKYGTKNEYMKWLDNNSIPYSSEMRKPELYTLIEKFKRIEREYKIDKILRAYGHKVVHLPKHMRCLTPLKYAWADIRTDLLLMSTDKRKALLLKDAVDKLMLKYVPNKWSGYVEAMKKLENSIFSNDYVIENMIENSPSLCLASINIASN